MSSNGHSSKSRWHAKGFSPASLKSHFKKHGKSMGLSSQTDYNNSAVNFMNSNSSTSEEFVDKYGTHYKYDPITNEFAMAKDDGTMITYFSPDKGEDYWEIQKELYDEDY